MIERGPLKPAPSPTAARILGSPPPFSFATLALPVSRLAPWILAAGFAALAHLVHGRVLERQAEAPPEFDVLYVPPAEHLVPMAMGYREALADLIWVRALIYSGENLGAAQIEATGRYVDAIVGLAPRFRRAYLWGGITAVYSGQATIDRPMVDRAIDIYRRGVAQFPESHELLYPFGMLLVTQVPSTPGYDAAERETLRQEGIEAIRRAAAFGADPLVRQYAATLIAEHGERELAIQFLESQLAQAEDEDHRRMLRSKLSALGGKGAADSVDRVRRDFSREHQVRAPYLPEALYAVVRDEAAAPVPAETSGTTRP